MAVLLGSTAFINFSSLSIGMNNEIVNSQNLILNQISNTIDSTMTSIERALYISSTEDSIQSFFDSSSKSSAKQIILEYDVQDELAQLAKIHNIDSIYLYNKANGRVLSNKNSGELNDFPDTEWLEYCNSAQNTYSWIGPRNIPTYNETVVSLIRTYPINSSWNGAKGFIVINITSSMLTDSLQTIGHSDSNEFLILDKDNKIIFRSNAFSPLSQDVFSNLDFSKDSDVITKKIADVKRSVFHVTNDKTHWKLVSVCTYNNLIKSITTIKYYLLVVFLGMLVILVIGIYSVSKRMYSPIDNFVNSISRGISKTTGGVSLKDIEDFFQYTYQRNETLNRQIQESLPGIKWKLINSILSNSYKDFDSLQSELEVINYSFYPDKFIVVIMDIDEINNLNSSSDEIDFYIASLSDKAEEQFNRIGLAISTKLLNNRVIVIVSFNKKLYNMEKCVTAIKKIQNFMQTCFNITITAALSDAVNDCTQISYAFHQATELQHYKIIVGYNSILTSDSVKPSEKKNVQALNTMIENLDRSLKTSPKQCHAIIEQLFDEIIAQRLPRELITHITIQVILTGIQNLGTSNVQDKAFDNEQIKNIVNSISQYETVSELKQVVINIYNDIMPKYDENNKALAKSNNDLIEKIVQFIREDYGDYNMSMSMLSKKFAISQSYLSKLLKDYSGKSFMELLIETRLKNAEIMLRTTNLKVSEIAKKVGYSNPTSFVRVFKQHYYLKPTEYRNKYILDQDKK